MIDTFIGDARDYNPKKLLSDLIAGLTVAIILIPQGMAYALLAGMPPVYGLYAALTPLLIYPIFATSRQLSVGPVALMSIIILSGVSIFEEPGTPRYIDMVLMTALLSGILQLVYSVLKLGVLSNFLSKPVMSGFISAAGVIIAISQIKYFLTLEVPRSSSVVQMLIDDFNKLDTSNWYSLILGGAGIAVILILKRIHKLIPSYLIAVVIGIVVLLIFDLQFKGVPIVGDIPQGLPGFYAGFLNFDYVVSLFPASLVISIICFIGSFSIAKTLAPKEQSLDISADKELVGLGMSKLISSFFMAMPSTGSFTRSAINKEAGAVSGFASIFAGVFIALTLAFFSSYFYYLPEPILAAIVITSVFSLIDYKEAMRLFASDKMDFWVLITTFTLTIVLGIVNGIMAGVVLSLMSVVIRSSKPHFAELGRLPHTQSFRNIKRYPEAETTDNVLIMRYDQDLFFANADHFYYAIIKLVDQRNPQKLVLHLGAINNIDSTAMDKMKELLENLKSRHVDVNFTNLSGPVRDKFHESGIYDILDKDAVHLSVAHAVLGGNPNIEINITKSKEYSSQTNK